MVLPFSRCRQDIKAHAVQYSIGASSQPLSEAGRHAVNSARSQDQTLIRRAGDELVEACEACHIAFKPDLPTMDMFGELSPLPPVSVQ